MRASTFTFLATAVSATQIPFFLPGMGSAGAGVAPDASIMAADSSTTVMALACPTNVDETECGWGNKDMVVSVVGTNVYALAYAAAGVRFDCTSKGAMTCTAAIAQEFTDAGLDGFTAGNDGTATGTTVYPSSKVFFQTARVTAGEEKLTEGSGAVETSTSASSSATATAKETGPKETGASSTLKTTGSVASTGAAPSATGANATGTATGSAAPVENTGAASKFGAAFFAVAGAAAVYVL